MNAYELKEYIIENDKVEDVLEEVGCHGITPRPTEYRAALPGGSNKTALSVKRDTLSSRIYTSSKTVNGDIITVVMELEGLEFKDAIIKIHNILGIEYNGFNAAKIEKKVDVWDCVKRHTRKHHRETMTLEKYEEEVLDKDNYLKLPYADWVREGIVPPVQRMFDVAYDLKSRRVLIPHRYWSTGEIVGIMGRTTIAEYDIYDIAKYFPLIAHSKSMNLYGLYENYHTIQRAKRVVVFEAEKSVMKAKSLNIGNAVALCGHEMSKEQENILIGLDAEIVIALDKGMDKQVSIDIGKRLKRWRPVYYIYDSEDILEDEKAAPIDEGKSKFLELFDNRIKI